MNSELINPPALTTAFVNSTEVQRAAPLEFPEPVPEEPREPSFLSSAWHHVTDASLRIERLQARLTALGVSLSESPRT